MVFLFHVSMRAKNRGPGPPDFANQPIHPPRHCERSEAIHLSHLFAAAQEPLSVAFSFRYRM
jgi:hypothetical protein